MHLLEGVIFISWLMGIIAGAVCLAAAIQETSPEERSLLLAWTKVLAGFSASVIVAHAFWRIVDAMGYWEVLGWIAFGLTALPQIACLLWASIASRGMGGSRRHHNVLIAVWVFLFVAFSAEWYGWVVPP